MLKKTVLTFAFLTILTTFYGFNAQFSTPVTDDMLLNDDAADFGNSLLGEGDYVISAYDNVIRNISEKEGHDWRLMSAIAYHESRFTPDITSRSGARGLMQIMPSVARQFDVPTRAGLQSRDQHMVGQQADVEDYEHAPFPRGDSREGSDEHHPGLVQQRDRPCERCEAPGTAQRRGSQFVGGRGPLPATQGASPSITRARRSSADVSPAAGRRWPT